MEIISLPSIARTMQDDPRIVDMGVKVKVNYEDEELEFLEEDVSVIVGDTTMTIIRAFMDESCLFTFFLCDGKLWEYEMFIRYLQDITDTHFEL